MKTLYYRFLLLLIEKPLWHLITSIVIIISIRILFIKTVQADMDIHLYEKFSTGYYSYRTPLDEVFVFNPVGELVGQFESVEQYREAIDIPIQIKPYHSTTINIAEKDNGNESAEPEHLMPLNQPLAYEEIIAKVRLSLRESTTKTELINNIIHQIKYIIPPNIWASSMHEFLGESKIEYYLEIFRSQNFSAENAVLREIFCSTVTAYNLSLLLGQENNTVLIEALILGRLEIDGFNLALTFPNIKNINIDSESNINLYLKTIQQIQENYENLSPMTQIDELLYPADIMQSISEIINKSHNKSDLVIRVLGYIQEKIPQHVLAKQWEDFNTPSPYTEFITYFMKNIPQQTQYHKLVAHVFYRGLAVYSATMMQENELSLEMLTDTYFLGLEESAGSEITKKLEIYLSDLEKT